MMKINEKKLIALVRKHPELYDVTHKKFSDVEYKKTVWKMISSKLLLNENDCCNTWIDLKFEYQNFVQNLRVWRLKKKKTKRPQMKYEREMIFLLRFIPVKNEISLKQKREIPANQFKKIIPKSNLSTNTNNNATNKNIAVIKNLKSKKQKPNIRILKREKFKRNLLEKIMYYPELYDINHPYYNEPTRKGIIWESIAKEIKSNVYKCIHSWFDLKTTYKHYVTALKLFTTRTLKPHKYRKELKFFEKFVNINETNASHSFFIWLRRPMENIPTTKVSIPELLKLVKYFSAMYNFDYRNYSSQKSLSVWKSIAKKSKSSESICERLFSSLRDTYTEICIINMGDHKFHSKWYYFDKMQNLSSTVQCYSVHTDQIDEKILSLLPNCLQHVYSMSTFDNFVKDDSSMDPVQPFLNDSDLYKLISTVKKYPKLYEEQPGNYDASTWAIIGRSMGYSGSLCRKYWLNLIKSYKSYEQKSIIDKSVFYPYYKKMSFLSQPVNTTEKTEKPKINPCSIKGRGQKVLPKKVVASTFTDFTSNQITKTTTETLTMQKSLPQISNVFSLSGISPMCTNDIPIQPIILTTPPPVHSMPSGNVYKSPTEISVQEPCTSGMTVTQLPSLLTQPSTSVSNSIFIQPSFLPTQPSTSMSNSAVLQPPLLLGQPSNSIFIRPPFLPTQPSTLISNSTVPQPPFLPAQLSTSVSNSIVPQPPVSLTQPSTSVSNSLFIRPPFLPTQPSTLVPNSTVSQPPLLLGQPSTSAANSTFIRPPFLPTQPSTSASNSTVPQPPLLLGQPSTSASAVTIDLSENELNQNYKVQGIKFLKILKLVNVIKKYECLFNYAHPQYCDQNDNIWRKVGDATDLPVEKCKEAWHTLRVKYWKYLCVDSTTRRQLSDEIKKIFEAMNFLSSIRNETHIFDKTDVINKLITSSRFMILKEPTKKSGVEINLTEDYDETIKALPPSMSKKLTAAISKSPTDAGNCIKQLMYDLEIDKCVTNGISMHYTILSTKNRNIFVKYVTNYVHLYCVKHQDYNNVYKKLKSWKQIAFLMDMSVVECRLLWEDMKQVYKKLKNENDTTYLIKAANQKSKYWIKVMNIIEQCIFNENHVCLAKTNTTFELCVRQLSKLPKMYQLKAFNRIKSLFGNRA